MFSFSRYKALLKAYLPSYFHTFGAMTGGKKKDKKKSSTIGSVLVSLLVSFGILFFIVSLCVTVYTFTENAVYSGVYREFLYLLLGAYQIVVLFFCGTITITYLYFANDTQLLLSLPLTPYETYGAKFTMSYLSQLLITVVGFFPILTYGITLAINGVNVSAWFYILSILNIFLVPSIPMFITCLISTPLMYIASLFKNKDTAKMIFSLISSCSFLAVYFLFSFGLGDFYGTSIGEESGVLSSESVLLLQKVSRFFIYNYNLVEGLLGNDSVLNGFLFILESLVFIVLSVVLGAFLYQKVLSFSLETGASKKNKKIYKEISFSNKSIKKSMFIKDLKLVFANPTLLVSTIVCAIMFPLFVVIFNGAFGDINMEGGVSGYDSVLINISWLTYLGLLLSVSSNSVTSISISLEKINIAVLKSLPISARDVIMSKLRVSAVLNGFVSILFFIAYCAISTLFYEPLIALFLAVFFFMSGMGVGIWEMYKDLEKPQFRYNNINELTKNNKKMVKPLLFILFFGIVLMVLGIVLANLSLNAWISFSVYFVILAVFCILVFVLPLNKMKKHAEELYEKMEI